MFKNTKSKVIDLFHINHFLLYFIIGLYYPNKYLMILIISLVWEVFEYILTKNKTLYNITKNFWIFPEKYWNENIYNKIIDLICNFIGYYVGSNSNNLRNKYIIGTKLHNYVIKYLP